MKATVGFLGVLVFGIAMFEVTMRPSGAERFQIIAIFAANLATGTTPPSSPTRIGSSPKASGDCSVDCSVME